jgi:hypothetical protein
MMDIVFYDQNGTAVAYSEDRIHIYLYNGDPVAYFDRDSIYSFSGTHLGWYKDGWILDHDGNAVFFTEHAQGGSLKPLKDLIPLKELKDQMPMKEIKEPKPLRPIKSLNWTQLSIEDFFLL